MPKHKETTGKAPSGPARASKQAGPKPRQKEGLRQGAAPRDLQAMQQTYGNQAVERMVLAARAKLGRRASDALNGPYAAAADRLEAAAMREGRTDLLEPFAALTPAQRMAVLRPMGVQSDTSGRLPEAIDWERLEAGIRSVQGVRLEEREVDAEAAVAPAGAERSAGAAADLAGLLAPYREIARWLHYKADTQGRADLMRLFDSLSIPQKKIALHKMAKRRKLDFGAFAEAMTVTIDLKEWVDWDAFASAVRVAERIRIDDAAADPLAYVSFGEEAGMEEEREDDGPDIGGMLAAAGLLGLGAETEEDERGTREQAAPAAGKAESLQARLTAPGQLGWLLLGIVSGRDGPAAVSDYVKQRPAREAVVDRFLGIPADSAGRSRTEQRGRLLRQQGFGSAEQCHAQIMRELAGLIAERGAGGADPAYAKLLGEWGLPPGKGHPHAMEWALKKLTDAG